MTNLIAHALRRRLGATVVWVVVFLWLPSAQAQPAGGVLIQAKAAYDARQYQQVITLLRPMLYPRSKLASEQEELTAYELLGKAYYWQGLLDPPNKKALHDQAEQQFGALLSLRPKKQLHALGTPGHLITFFEAVRRKLKARSSPLQALETELKHCRRKVSRVQKDFAAYRKAATSQVEVTRTVRRRHYFWNFVPFGAGQFQNGHTVKGSLFAAFQGALLISNVTAWILGESPYVRVDWGGTLRPGENKTQSEDRAQRIQITMITTGALFWGLALWGIIDAIVFYKKTTVTRDRKLIPLGTPNVGLVPELGRDRLVLGLEARF